MISLTRLNHVPVLLNSDLIETIETTPDTVIRLTTGQKLVVREGTEEIVDKVRSFRRSVIPTPGEFLDSVRHTATGETR